MQSTSIHKSIHFAPTPPFCAIHLTRSHRINSSINITLHCIYPSIHFTHAPYMYNPQPTPHIYRIYFCSPTRLTPTRHLLQNVGPAGQREQLSASAVSVSVSAAAVSVSVIVRRGQEAEAVGDAGHAAPGAGAAPVRPPRHQGAPLRHGQCRRQGQGCAVGSSTVGGGWLAMI